MLKIKWNMEKKVPLTFTLQDENDKSVSEYKVPKDLDVRTLKSIILNKSNKPFFFEFKEINDLRIEDYLKRFDQPIINVSFDQNLFNLLVKDNFEKLKARVFGLTSNSTL